jgi:hypothetical protein
MTPAAPTPGRTSVAWPWLIFSLVLPGAVYLWTMWPSMAGGDSGELTAAAYTLGVVHPPGYPLYTMLAHLFTYLPAGGVAWRVNFLSVVCALGAQALLFATLLRLVRTAWLAAAVSLTFAFSALTWRYAIAAEVFALNNLFAAALMYLFVRALEDERTALNGTVASSRAIAPKKYFYLMALVFGLGMSHHHTILFVGLPLGAYLLWRFRSQMLKPSWLATVIGMFSLGLAPYGYLFWASARVPLISWGEIASWEGFFNHLLRADYGTFRLATNGSDRFQLFWGLGLFLWNFAQAVFYLGLIPFGIGAVALFRNHARGAARTKIWLAVPVSYLVVFHILANLPIADGMALYRDIVSRFWLMPTLLLMPVLAIGAMEILNHRRIAARAAFGGLVKVILFLAPLGLLVTNFQPENHHGNHAFADFGKAMIANLPPKAVFFSVGDINTNTVRYVQACENFRPDVQVLDRSLMTYDWYRRIAARHFPDVVLPGMAYHPRERGHYDFKRLFDANFARHPIFVTSLKPDSTEAFDQAWTAQYELIPYGILYKVKSKDRSLDFAAYVAETEKLMVDPVAAFAKTPAPGSWDEIIQANYRFAAHQRAAEILKYGIRTGEKVYLMMAEALLEEQVARHPAPTSDYFKNLGIAHQQLMKLTEGEAKAQHEKKMLDAWVRYVRDGNPKEEAYDQIAALLKAHGR